MRVRTQIDGETSVRGSVSDGNHREWATFRGSNGMLELLNVESNVERRPSGIHLVSRRVQRLLRFQHDQAGDEDEDVEQTCDRGWL